MGIIKKRKAKEILQFIEDNRLSFDFMELRGDEIVHILGAGEGNKKIHYAMYPIRECRDLKDGFATSDKGWLRESIEFIMDMKDMEEKSI